ncbi:hypothetical protein O181_059434 [Austropuccinia psidii MF-1]|uniref:Uncharacterized protein n=1 Tax=Austropuccinia psidii MF-1 TaxID=1389203 RepID=A0A9Q3EE98_9BASI|nr:hypothetical protein [Austropuccinia psidii MF-1]
MYRAGPQLTNHNTVRDLISPACQIEDAQLHKRRDGYLQCSSLNHGPVDIGPNSFTHLMSKYPNLGSRSHCYFHVSFQHKRTLYGQPTAYQSTPLWVPSSSASNMKSGSNLFGSDSGIYHPMELDEQSSDEFKGEDDEYLIADDSCLGVEDDTPPKKRKLAGKRRRIQLF